MILVNKLCRGVTKNVYSFCIHKVLKCIHFVHAVVGRAQFQVETPIVLYRINYPQTTSNFEFLLQIHVVAQFIKLISTITTKWY